MWYLVYYHLAPKKRGRGKRFLYFSVSITVDDPSLAEKEARRTIEEMTALWEWDYFIDSINPEK